MSPGLATATGGPLYVERGGEIVFRQPFRASGARMWCFVLQGDGARIDAVYDRYVNSPSCGAEAMSGAGSRVILNFVDIATLGSTDPEDSRLGTTAERECGLWVPGIDHRRDDRLVWTLPYLFVDSGWPMATGRETYGFPKQLADIHLDGEGAAITRFAVDTMALRRFAPEAVAMRERVIEVRPCSDETGHSATTWKDPSEGRDRMRALCHPDENLACVSPRTRPSGSGPLLGAAEVGLALFEALIGDWITLVLLRQFRSCVDPRRASYSAVVEVSMVATDLRGGGLITDAHEVELADLDSEPIARELGLPAGPLRPELAFWIDFDFELTAARELWLDAAGVVGRTRVPGAMNPTPSTGRRS